MTTPTPGTPFALIVEDDNKLATIFTKALQEAGYYTETIQRGDFAMTRLDEVVPDVVILDLHLPYVGGTDILDRIRREPRLAPVKVVAATADLYLAKESIQDKADWVLIKPVSFTRLRDLVAELRPPST
jgi:DNA-binding response OmpR family regulator